MTITYSAPSHNKLCSVQLAQIIVSLVILCVPCMSVRLLCQHTKLHPNKATLQSCLMATVQYRIQMVTLCANQISTTYLNTRLMNISTSNFVVPYLVIVQSGHCCSGTESVTALICSGWNQTEPDTGYSHLLDCC